MFFGVIGIILLVVAVAFAFNVKGAAERAFVIFRQTTPRMGLGNPTPKTLRLVGAIGIPFGVFAILVSVLR